MQNLNGLGVLQEQKRRSKDLHTSPPERLVTKRAMTANRGEFGLPRPLKIAPILTLHLIECRGSSKACSSREQAQIWSPRRSITVVHLAARVLPVSIRGDKGAFLRQ